MKHIIITTIFIFLCCIKGYGQKFYINAGVGYGSDKFAEGSYDPYPQRSFYGTCTFGYYLTNRFNFEVAFDNFSDNKGTMPYNYSTCEIIRIMPILKFKITKSFNAFYIKYGFAFNLYGKMTSAYTSQNDLPPYNINTETFKESGSSFNGTGGILAIGKDTRIYENNVFGIYSFFVEFVSMSDFWQPSHMSITETTAPVPVMKIPSFYYSTVGIQFGLKYSFGRK
jgi:hypothetical protein